MKTPPQITIGVNTPSSSYALVGFEDLDLWMRHNDATYNAAAKNAEMHGMTEADTLRYLLAAMANKATRAEAMLNEHIKRHGIPVVLRA